MQEKFRSIYFYLIAILLIATSCNIKINYIGPVENGEYIQYYSDSTIKSIEFYKNNRKNGLTEYYREDGSLKETGYYIKDRKDSIWTTYRGDGTIEMQGERNGQNKIGFWVFYDKKGNVLKKEKYVGNPENEFVSHRLEYNQNNLVSEKKISSTDYFVLTNQVRFVLLVLFLFMPKIFLSYFMIISLEKNKDYKFQPKDQATRLLYSISAIFLFFWYGDRVNRNMKYLNNSLGVLIMIFILIFSIGHLMSDKI